MVPPRDILWRQVRVCHFTEACAVQVRLWEAHAYRVTCQQGQRFADAVDLHACACIGPPQGPKRKRGRERKM